MNNEEIKNSVKQMALAIVKAPLMSSVGVRRVRHECPFCGSYTASSNLFMSIAEIEHTNECIYNVAKGINNE